MDGSQLLEDFCPGEGRRWPRKSFYRQEMCGLEGTLAGESTCSMSRCILTPKFTMTEKTPKDRSKATFCKFFDFLNPGLGFSLVSPEA